MKNEFILQRLLFLLRRDIEDEDRKKGIQGEGRKRQEERR